MTALSALGCVPPLRSCADSVSLSPLSNALSRESVSERQSECVSERACVCVCVYYNVAQLERERERAERESDHMS